MNWKDELVKLGAIWQHDGHPDRPYALLTSGEISGHFVDITYAIIKPKTIAAAAKNLARKIQKHFSDPTMLVICGQQKGSTTLASRIAEEIGSDFFFTDKVGEGASKKMVVDERFAGVIPTENRTVILVEDVTTSALTSSKSRDALYDFGFVNVSDILLTLVDRTGGSNSQGFKVLSCYTPDNFHTWQEGSNPHTVKGKELVPPVRAKTPKGRKALRAVLSKDL